ncbi:UDP-glucose 4-epimerase GalE [Candidatus Neomarinimicrobiota bacterium]
MSSSTKRIMVAGGAGYIGCHVVLDLLDTGYDVTVLDNLSNGSREAVPEGVRFIEGDVLNPSDLDRAFEPGCDAVFHFAALKAAGESMLNLGEYARVNLSGSLNLLEAMSRHAVDNLVFSSSAAVYGYPQTLPIDEDHPTEPINYYGYTKLAIEQNMAWYSRLKDLRYASLRYFNAAGYDMQGRIHTTERNSANLLPLVMEVATGRQPQIEVYGTDYDTPDGSCIRDYIHVTDLSKAHLSAMDHLLSARDNLVLNLGTGQGYSVLEVLDHARAITGHPIPAVHTDRREGDPAELRASSERAFKQLGWRAEHSRIEDILESMWRVYRGANSHR